MKTVGAARRSPPRWRLKRSPSGKVLRSAPRRSEAGWVFHRRARLSMRGRVLCRSTRQKRKLTRPKGWEHRKAMDGYAKAKERCWVRVGQTAVFRGLMARGSNGPERGYWKSLRVGCSLGCCQPKPASSWPTSGTATPMVLNSHAETRARWHHDGLGGGCSQQTMTGSASPARRLRSATTWRGSSLARMSPKYRSTYRAGDEQLLNHGPGASLR